MLPRPSNCSIKVGQINLARSKTATEELGTYAKQHNIDILIIQEPYAKSNRIVDLGIKARMVCTQKCAPWAAVAVLNERYTVTQLGQNTTALQASARITTKDWDIIVTSIYGKVTKDSKNDIRRTLRELRDTLMITKDRGHIVGMDANAKSTLWFSKKTDKRGEKLEQFMAQHNLRLANVEQDLTTYEGPRGRSNIDITLTSGNRGPQIVNWSIIGDATTSDHNLIRFNIVKKSTTEEEIRRIKGLLVTNKKFDKLRKELEKSMRVLATPPTNKDEINKQTEELTVAIQTACRNTFSPRKNTRNKPWWNSSLDKKKKACYHARRAYQRAETQTTKVREHDKYKEARKAYTEAIVQAKRESWKRFVEGEGTGDVWRVVQAVKKLDDLPRPIATTTTQMQTQTWEAVADGWLDHFLKTDEENEDTDWQKEWRTTSKTPSNNNIKTKIEPKEIIAYIKVLKTRVAPGLDDIGNIIVKAAPDIIAKYMTTIVNACLQQGVFPDIWKEARMITLIKGPKKDRNEMASYRPICLLSTLGKLFERILRSRIQDTIKENPRQFGFTQGRSTTDAIQEIVNHRESKAKLVIAVMLDISAAFDSVWWPSVLMALKENDCPRDVYTVMQDYFKNRQVILQEGDSTRRRVQSRGCPQGSVLGPTLWNLVFDGLLRDIETQTKGQPTAYADDLVIVVEGENIQEIEREAQYCVNRVMEWCGKHKLGVSTEKSCLLMLKGNIRGQNPAIHLGNQKMRMEQSAKYLGIEIDKGIRFHSHCSIVREKVKNVFHKFRGIARSKWGLRHESLQIIYKAICIPIITYGAGAWAEYATQKDFQILTRAQRAALLVITRAYRTISEPALLVIANVKTVQHKLEDERLKRAIRQTRVLHIGGAEYDPKKKSASTLRDENEARQQTEQQRTWETDSRGRTTFEFFPTIAGRREAIWIKPNYYLTQFLSGHGNFRSKLRKFSLVKTDKCQCGSKDTPRHTFYECERFKTIRETYKRKILSVGLKWPPSSEQSIQENIIKETTEYVAEILKEKEVWDHEIPT